MTTPELIAKVRDRNIELWVEGDKLRFNAPRGALTNELKAELIANKAELVRFLSAARAAAAPAIARVDRSGSLPLSFAQQRLWFLDQLQPGSALYNMPGALRLTGELDVEALRRAFETIVERHETLRTRFVVENGEPRQHIVPPMAWSLPLVEHGETALADFLQTEALRPFDLATGPLLRTLLVRLGPQDHVLQITMHHVISDGWSVGVMIAELKALYGAFLRGAASPLPALELQYGDFAVWQREWLSGERVATQLEYWKRHLADVPALALPTDRPRLAQQRFRGARIHFEYSTELTNAARSLADRLGCSQFMLLFAVYQVLLGRYARQERFCVGTPIANRNQAALEGLIGFFVNTLGLKVDLSGDPSFRTLVARVRTDALAAYEHQDLPFERLVEEMGLERDLSGNPLFQTLFVLQNTPVEELSLPGLTLSPIDLETHTAKFDIGFEFTAASPRLTGRLEYDTDLFDADSMERLVDHYRRLLEAVVADPDRPLSELPLLTPAEGRALIEARNPAPTAYPESSIPRLFEAQAARTPSAPAVVWGAERLSYAELDARANRLAHCLRAAGVGAETRVGLCLPRQPDMVVAVLAVLKAGGAYLPLDPNYPRERLSYMLADAGAELVLTHDALAERLPADVRTLALDQLEDELRLQPEEVPAVTIDPDQLAYVIYTSGSTGRPKGVLVTHRGLCNLQQGQIEGFGITAADKVLQFASLSFDASASELTTTLCSGACLVLADQETLLTPEALASLVRAEGVTVATIPPSVLALLDPATLPLETVITAGEACPPDLVARWAKNRRFINAYGPTEITVCATLGDCDPADVRPPSIGRPLANTRVYLLDDHLRPVPVGMAGELYVGGVGVSRGYHDRPELTAERFLPDPFSDRARRAHVSHRRPGPLSGRRPHRVPRSSATTRSSCAASASSWARSSPRCANIRPCATPPR